MKLSDAIRCGAKLRPQAFYGMWGKNNNEGSCAMGAAAEMNRIYVGTSDLEVLATLKQIYPELGVARYNQAMTLTTPQGHTLELSGDYCLADVIIRMNDRLRMTREEIADCLDANPQLMPSRTDVEFNRVASEAAVEEVLA